MRLLRSFPVLAFSLVFLSIIGLSIAQQSPGLLLVAGALAAISWFVTEGPRGRSLPRWVSNILVLAIALHAVAEFARFHENIHVHEILGRFGVWLTIIKLYERRTARDYAHLMMLSFLLMLVASLHSADLIFGIILLAYVLLGLYVLLLYQLHAAYEGAREHRQFTTPTAAIDTAGYRLLPPLKPIIGQQPRSQFRSLAAGVAVAGMVLGFVAFLAFPRGLSETLFGMPGSTGRAQVGFTENVRLMSGSRITDSRRPVMSVQLLDQRGEPFEHHGPLLLRGAINDFYEGDGVWRAASHSHRERLDVSPEQFHPLGSAAPDAGRSITQVVRSYVDRPVFFSLYAPVAVKAERTHMIDYDARRQMLTVPSVPGARAPSSYSIRVELAPTQEALHSLVAEQPIGDLDGLRRLRHEDIADLAQEQLLAAGLNLSRPSIDEDPAGYWRWARDVAHILKRFLHSGDFSYGLDLDFAFPTENGRAVDPVRYFLLELRYGHCEYFASALIALLANLDIEARIVTGYLAGEFDSRAQRYEVLERNAHAWVEVRTGPRRWMAVDPTPPAAISAIIQTPPNLSDRFRGMYDRATSLWSRQVIDFDWRAQQRLAERLDGGISDRAVTGFNAVRRWLGTLNLELYLGRAGYLYLAFLGSVLAFALYVLVRLMRRSAAIRRAAHLEHAGPRHSREYQRLLRDAGFYCDMLDVLARHGHAKPQWLPPLAFAGQLARSHPGAAKIVRELTRRFYQSRYGGRPLTAEELPAMRSRLAELSAEVAASKTERLRGGAR